MMVSHTFPRLAKLAVEMKLFKPFTQFDSSQRQYGQTEKQNNRFNKTKYKNNLEPKKKKKNWMAFHGKQIFYNMMV